MTDGSTMDFSHMKYTHISPMARNLFGIDGITRVFYGKDFISVQEFKDEDLYRSHYPNLYYIGQKSTIF